MESGRVGREYFERLFRAGEDPWDYRNAYETGKYDQTLSLVPDDGPIARALEIGCAEGLFTERLAPRVGALVAVDIAEAALERARRRCRDLSTVRFRRLDLFADDLPSGFDLVVCSEILYFAGSDDTLARTARKVASALRPGGRLVAAHANVIADDPDQPGFDWRVAFGARRVAEVLAGTDSLALERELRTELYRVQRFRRLAPGENAPAPVVEHVQHGPLTGQLRRHACWPRGAAR